jgi:CubicO group peptidase (beta-lactamase class C family)
MIRRSLLFLPVCLFAADPNPSNLDRIIEETRRAFQAPGIAAAIVTKDKVIYSKGFGVKALGSSDAVTTDTRFAIGSTTKAFTTAAMGLLVDEGKMNWDDPVRQHVPYFRLSDPLADANVTMRDIVCHRTGLSRNDLLWFGSPWSREEIIRKIGLVPLAKPFRSAYQYQNIMFLTAGVAVGRIAGSSWEEFVESRLFRPLGMTNSDFSTTAASQSADHATPHEKRKGEVTRIPWRNIDNIGPAGSINSSVNDLSRWVRMQLSEGSFEGKSILKPATVREMHTPQMAIRMDDPNQRTLALGTNMSSYGLGWVIQDYRGHHMVSHGGAIDGFRAQVTLLPNDGFGIILLANLGGNNMPECLRAAIADELLGLEAQGWNKRYLEVAKKQEDETAKRREERDKNRQRDTKPSRELALYAGDYEHPAYGRATVERSDNGLKLRWSNWQAPLEHFHFDTFRATGGPGPMADSLVTFQLNAEGKPASVTLVENTFRRK